MTDEPEIWRESPLYRGYWASSLGRIRGRRGWVLKTKTLLGYQSLCLWVNGKRCTALVSRIVCSAFHGLPPTKEHQAAHGNGVRSDNRPSNLRWATNSENRMDMIGHGTWPVGERHPRSTLTEKQVLEIKQIIEAAIDGRQRRPKGLRRELAKQFDCSEFAIKDIIAGRTWTGGSLSGTEKI